MYTEKQIKGYAQALRKALSTRNLDLTHGQSLELIAETLGEKSWNHLSAKLPEANSRADHKSVPDGWSLVGQEHFDCYNVQIVGTKSAKTLLIECIRARSGCFASLMQFVRAETYIGAHVRMTAEVSTVDAGQTSLWIRVDGKPRRTLAFDNMVDVPPFRALEGTNDWTKLELVLAVPPGADIVNFGCMLAGKGIARFRNVSFEKVATSVPESSVRLNGGDNPVNLGFD